MAHFVCNEYGFVSVTKLLERISSGQHYNKDELAIEELRMLYKILIKQTSGDSYIANNI